MNNQDLLTSFTRYHELKTSFHEKQNNPLQTSPIKLELAEAEMKDAFKELKLSIIDILNTENDFYQKIAQQNSELLYNKSFEVKVIKVVNSPGENDKFSTRFEGGIFPNGFLYFKSVAVNENFTFQSYASRLKGKMDHHGAGEVIAINTQMDLIKTLPASYDAKIDQAGNIHLEITELDASFDASLIAYHLAGDPFAGSEKRRKLFLRNRSEMNRLIGLKLEDLEKIHKK